MSGSKPTSSLKFKRLVTDLRQQLEMMTTPVVVGVPWFWGWFRYIAVILCLTVLVLSGIFAALCLLAVAVMVVTLDFEAAQTLMSKLVYLIVLTLSPVIPLFVLGYRFPGQPGHKFPEKPDNMADEIDAYRDELAREHATEDATLDRKALSEGMVSIVDDVSEGGQLSPAAEDGELSLSEKPSND